MGKKCPEYVSELNDYLDGTLDEGLCSEIEKHLGTCANCRIMVDTMRMTVTLCRDGKPEPMPDALSARLNGLLKTRWEQKFGKPQP
ncbi:MAG: zf-HC2 domain-containing protein [candidate division Zixibacteria bacterium]|nr:zf-HC2 domain-containing protein [candidate division Zixibacteria bacterium]